MLSAVPADIRMGTPDGIMTAEENLKRLGITLPSPPAAVGKYAPWGRTGNLIVMSGQLPWDGPTMKYAGRLGRELTTEEGYQAARLAAINAIAQLKDAAGDLENIARIVRVEGYAHCSEGYREQPQVLNGASDLLVEVFEDRGIHTRIALGIPDMPLNAAVQISVWAEVRS